MKYLSRSASAVVIVALIASNVLTLTNSAVHDMLYRGFSMLPFEMLQKHSPTRRYENLERAHKQIHATAKRLAKRIGTRTVRTAVMSSSAMAVESVPWFGAAAVVAMTAYELHAACETMKDVDNMLITLDSEPTENNATKVCGQTREDWFGE